MKKYMTIVALLAAGSAFANAAGGTADFDFKASDLGGATDLVSVTLSDELTKFDATVTALSGYLTGGAWSGQAGPEYDFIEGASKSFSTDPAPEYLQHQRSRKILRPPVPDRNYRHGVSSAGDRPAQ